MTIEDPVAYVQELEPESELEVTTEEDGAILIKTKRNGAWIKYTFSE